GIGEGVAIWLPSAGPPVITDQPHSQTVTQGQTATFTVAASGGAALQYQWIFCPKPFWNLTLPPIPLATTGPVLTVGNVQSVDAGDYLVVLSNSSGSVTSAVARLTFVPATSCVVFDGLEHCPAGTAGVNVSSNSLFISNIGS